MAGKSYGGEGKGSYSGRMGPGAMKQHGGEGKQLSMKSDMNLLDATSEYCGPGRYLKSMTN